MIEKGFIVSAVDRVQRDEPETLGIVGRNGVTFKIFPSGGDPVRILVYKDESVITSFWGFSLDRLNAYSEDGRFLNSLPLGKIKRRKPRFGFIFERG